MRPHLGLEFDQSDLESATFFVDLLVEDKRRFVISSGVGKSANPARFLASCFRTVGVQAWFLDPLDSLHGGMGVLGPEAVVFVFSRSGNTPELVALARVARDRGAVIVSVTEDPFSALPALSDARVLLPPSDEPFWLPIEATIRMTVVAGLLQYHLVGRTRDEPGSSNHPGSLTRKK